jgi:hypothetical protein
VAKQSSGQLFGRSRSLFGLYQNLFSASVQTVALRLTVFLGPTYLCEEAFSQTKIIKSRYRSRLADEFKILPSLVPK